MLLVTDLGIFYVHNSKCFLKSVTVVKQDHLYQFNIGRTVLFASKINMLCLKLYAGLM